MIKVPPYLKTGDTIALICPAGYMGLEKIQTCVETLQKWGFKTRIGKTVGSNSTTYFSGSDEARLADFQKMLDDDSVHAILFARGGYGLGRIIDQIDFTAFKKNPKWLLGYSDITVLHSHIFSNFGISSIHSPMAAAFNNGEDSNVYVQSILDVLTGTPISYQCAPHEFNRTGKARGLLAGGNLTLLAHLVGTPSDIVTKGRILFIEDVGEYLYNIDRMMYQLKRAGKLKKLAGIIVGGFTDSKDTERPFGLSAYEIIRDIVSEYDYPVCFNFPVSHEKENYALKVGMKYKLKVSSENVTLIES